jgi:hypothetical protein
MVNTSALHLEMKSTSTISHSGGARRSKEIENNDQENMTILHTLAPLTQDKMKMKGYLMLLKAEAILKIMNRS